MDADEGARALAIQVQVAALELALPAREAPAVPRLERAGQSVLRVVGHVDALIEVLDRQDREDGPEDLLARQAVRGLDPVHDRRHDEEALRGTGRAARD